METPGACFFGNWGGTRGSGSPRERREMRCELGFESRLGHFRQGCYFESHFPTTRFLKDSKVRMIII